MSRLKELSLVGQQLDFGVNMTFFSSKFAETVFGGFIFKLVKPANTMYVESEALGNFQWCCLYSNQVGLCFRGHCWLKRYWDTLHRPEDRHALSSLNKHVDTIINSTKEFQGCKCFVVPLF